MIDWHDGHTRALMALIGDCDEQIERIHKSTGEQRLHNIQYLRRSLRIAVQLINHVVEIPDTPE